MPLPGGHSNKLGNQYEGLWTASVMLELLQDDDGSFCLEPLGANGEKIEFWVERSGVREVHQVKRQNNFAGRWTIAQLNQNGVLGGFRGHLARPDTVAHFVSTDSVEGLAELTERAQHSPDLAAFQAYYLKAEDARSTHTNFGRCWGTTSEPALYDALRRIHVHTISNADLCSLLKARAALWFAESPKVIASTLESIAIDRMSQDLRPVNIWTELRARGIEPRPMRDLATVSESVHSQTTRYLAGGQDIAGERLDRPEVPTLVETLEGDVRVAWVVGAAGAGKSEVARDVVRVLQARWPTLAFRLDHLTPTASVEEIGAQLGLRLSPTSALAATAQGGDSVLVIDQLDAVSIVSGRRGALFEVVRETVDAARFHGNMRVVVVCRQFDLDNDHRLRQLKDRDKDAHTVKLGELTAADVVSTVGRVGGNPAQLTTSQVQLLALPLHLAIYAHVIAMGEAFSEFTTPIQLFAEFCRRKRRATTGHAGVDHWTDVTNRLVQRMSRDELLSIPWRTLTQWEPYAEAMASEHVLVRDLGRVGFFHDSLFDYLFGLSFADERPLTEWLRADEQGLFRRAQVRQVLAFRRDDDRKRYIADLRDLLLDNGVRFHLKHLVLNLLGQVAAPDSDEAAIVRDFIQRSEFSAHRHALSATAAKGGWFLVMKDAVRELLESEDNAIRSYAFWWLSRAVDQYPDEVADIVASFVDRGADWPDTVACFVSICRGYTTGTRFVEMVVRLVQSGALDQRSIWMWLAEAGQAAPTDWSNVCRVVNALLRRNLVVAEERDEAVSLEEHWAGEVIEGLAKANPGGFVDGLLPVFIDALQGEPQGGNHDTFPDDGLTQAIWGSARKGAWTSLVDGLVAAVGALLAAGDARGTEVQRTLSAMESITAQSTAARAYMAGGRPSASEAITWLLADRRRLHLQRVIGPNRTVELIQAGSPHCDHETYRALEKALLRYYPRHETQSERREAFGRGQWRLIAALPDNRISQEAKRRRGELNRKHGDEVPATTSTSGAYRITSPIEPEGTQQMSDDAWLKAIERYSGSWERNWSLDGRPTGGASELAVQLQARAAEEPERFALLAQRLPADTNPAYLAAILAGVARAGLPLGPLELLIGRAHAILDRPHGRVITHLVKSNAALAWSSETLGAVAWYATEDPDPDAGRMGSDGSPVGERLQSLGINSVRGTAAECLGVLIDADASRLSLLRSAVDAVVVDEHPAVRACAAVTCIGVLRHDADTALDLTDRLLAAGGAARATPPVERLLWYLLPAHTERLAPALQEMVADPTPEVVAVGARLVCLVALSDESARGLADACLEGNDVQREAAATVLAANVGKAAHRVFCEQALRALFDDRSETVRKEAASCFRVNKDVDVAELPKLVLAFVASPAFNDDMDGLLYALERSREDCAELIVAASERFLELAGDDTGDIQTHAALTAHGLRTLIVRAYAQSTPRSNTRRRCLDVIDGMFLHSVHDLDSTIAAAGR